MTLTLWPDGPFGVLAAVAATPTQQLIIGAAMLGAGVALTVRFPTRAAALSRPYTVAVRAGWLLVALLGLVTAVIGVVRLV